MHKDGCFISIAQLSTALHSTERLSQATNTGLLVLKLTERIASAIMALPTTYRAFRRTEGDLPHTIQLSEETLPQNIEPHDVLIKIHAVSLNYRDVAMLNGKYPVEVEVRGIPASDCAAEVVAVGSDVTNFKKGDHVAPIFNLSVLTGHEDDAMQALGGDVPGVLREYAVFDESVLVHLPPHLSWEEVSHDSWRFDMTEC